MRSPHLDTRVLTDPSWLHWATTVPLLAGVLAGKPWALALAMTLCAALTGYYFARLRALKPFPVQVRLVYFTLLALGTIPGLHGIYWVPLVGTSAVVFTGYCPLARLLSLLPVNRRERLTGSLLCRTLFAPADGGLFRWPAEDPLPAESCCSLRPARAIEGCQ